MKLKPGLVGITMCNLLKPYYYHGLPYHPGKLFFTFPFFTIVPWHFIPLNQADAKTANSVVAIWSPELTGCT